MPPCRKYSTSLGVNNSTLKSKRFWLPAGIVGTTGRCVGAVDTLDALGPHALHAEQVGALGRPVARAAGAVFLAREHHQRHAAGLVLHRGVVDRHALAANLAEV